MKYQLLIVFLFGLSLGTVGTAAGANNISGTWSVSIDQRDQDGPVNLTFVFKQEGEKLTGAYLRSGQSEEAKVTGTVKENKVTFSYEIKPPPQIKKPGLTVTFTGTIESPTKITGSIGRPFCDECKWTATKMKK
jgi:hypothetical protein